MMKTELWAIILVIIAGVIGAFGPIYLKKGAEKIERKKLMDVFRNRPLIIGILIYAISTVLFIPALKGGDLSVLYPLVALDYVWVVIYSKILLKEKMTAMKWVGIVTIIVGVSFIGFGA